MFHAYYFKMLHFHNMCYMIGFTKWTLPFCASSLWMVNAVNCSILISTLYEIYKYLELKHCIKSKKYIIWFAVFYISTFSHSPKYKCFCPFPLTLSFSAYSLLFTLSKELIALFRSQCAYFIDKGVSHRMKVKCLMHKLSIHRMNVHRKYSLNRKIPHGPTHTPRPTKDFVFNFNFTFFFSSEYIFFPLKTFSSQEYHFTFLFKMKRIHSPSFYENKL